MRASDESWWLGWCELHMHLYGEVQRMTRGKGGCTTGVINDSVETMRDESGGFLKHPERKYQHDKIGSAGLVMNLMRLERQWDIEASERQGS